MRRALLILVVAACSKKQSADCPLDMIAIPAGSFTMDDHEVKVKAFCIDRTEVTVKAFAACVDAKVCTPAATVLEESPSINQAYMEPLAAMCNGNKPDRADHPVNCIDWTQAQVYCAWAKKELPTEEQWEFAARGTDGRRYPWGNEAPDAAHLNAAGAEYKQLYASFANKEMVPMYNADDGHPTTAPVGTIAGDRSAFGVMDMGGNVWEWTATKTEDKRYIGKGGGFDYNDPTWVRTTHHSTSAPTFRYVSLGFRCAQSR